MARLAGAVLRASPPAQQLLKLGRLAFRALVCPRCAGCGYES